MEENTFYNTTFNIYNIYEAIQSFQNESFP